MEQPSVRVMKQTKRSEKEVDIRPMIYQWELGDSGIFLQLAAGSSENLKPDLVMDAFLKYAGISSQETVFMYHRLEMYADAGQGGERKLVTLESLGEEMSQTEGIKR